MLDLTPTRDIETAKLDAQVDRLGDELLIPEGAQTIPCTHGMHRFPGKFIPNVPRYLMRSVLPSDSSRIVLDPFCGSGTTLVEAALEGRAAVGLDIDPLAVMVARAKTQLLPESVLKEIELHWTTADFEASAPELVPDVPNLMHWFTEEAVQELTAIKRHCLELPAGPREFCLVVLSSIIRRVSKADDQTQKTYVSGTLPKSPPLPSALFPVFMSRAVTGMRQYRDLLPAEPRVSVRTADARDFEAMQFDDVLTSPPYIDSIDYVHNQMLEYYWLLPELGLPDYAAYVALRKQPMGFTRSGLEVLDGLRGFLHSDRIARLESSLERIQEKSLREAQNVVGFFDDFVRHLKAVSALQSPDAYYACVVGNSWIRGGEVPTVDILSDIFEHCGYHLEDKASYEIRRHYMKFPRRENSGKITRDHILVLRKSQ